MKVVIAAIGPGETATDRDRDNAYNLGRLVAQQGWILLTGGRNVGVMDAASRGAKSFGGLTIGILPGKELENISEAVDIPIVTDLGNARNNIIVLSARAIVACGIGLGTASEIGLALKGGKKVILLMASSEAENFFTSLAPNDVLIAKDAESALNLIKYILKQSN